VREFKRLEVTRFRGGGREYETASAGWDSGSGAYSVRSVRSRRSDRLTYTGSLVDFTVPATDAYQILAFGAQGGNVTFTFA
jgi:hypothetical protein